MAYKICLFGNSFCKSAIKKPIIFVKEKRKQSLYFFYLDAPNAVHVKYNCLVSNGIKKGHLLVSCSHQSGKAPLASAKGSCSLMQEKERKKEKSVSNIRLRLSQQVCSQVHRDTTHSGMEVSTVLE